jgi:hypothetical protein
MGKVMQRASKAKQSGPLRTKPIVSHDATAKPPFTKEASSQLWLCFAHQLLEWVFGAGDVSSRARDSPRVARFPGRWAGAVGAAACQRTI